jgi:alkanesulfonate monooxygenase SsuD/methylene tetrahydromethanopterin reductase-like flavin-dependent oxidoreductase (luciferase family)
MSGAGRFGVMLYPDQPVPVLLERVQWLADLGFDQVFLPDHSADLRDRRHLWFDSWSILAAAASNVERVRLGILVANQILRPPSRVAKQAITVDHLSGGRFELGIGAGLFDWDHHSVGEDPWSPRERAERFADYVAIVDGLLRGSDVMFSYAGSRLWVKDIARVPGSLQSPRLPIIVAGQSPTVLRVAATHADVWNTLGPPGAPADVVLNTTAEQNRKIDRLAIAAGRDPAAIRRSYTIFGSWDPLGGKFGFAEIFERFEEIGITDFVLDWPDDSLRDEFERVATEVIPALRAR